MAVFTVLNGTGLNGAGIQFGTLSQIATSGIAGFPIITPITGTVFFNDTGLLSIGGTGMSFTLPSTFGGTVNSLTYSKPAITPIFSIAGMNTALADVASGFLTPGGELAALAIIFSGNDTIGGSAQADFLIGLDGNDTLRGGAGADILIGGHGSDFANYQGSSAEVFVDLQTPLVFSGDAAGDVLNSIENLYGSSFGDTLSGDAGRNIIGGEGGADLLDGRAGDDALSGETGDDILNGRDGADRLVGGDGTDTLSGEAGNDSIDGGAGNDGAFGGADNDGITGAFIAAGQIRVLAFAGNRYGVYLETTGNNVEDAVITVTSDHALTAADFAL
jgi:Ca2+-binding RTX toxin-like protein